MGTHNQFGELGEQMAADYLKRNGYAILRRNYRYLRAEVDIIAQKETILAIVEVRSRSSEFHESIAHTVNKKKIKLLTMAADHFVVDNNLDVEVRFDIITLLKKEGRFFMEHLQDAFYHF